MSFLKFKLLTEIKAWYFDTSFRWMLEFFLVLRFFETVRTSKFVLFDLKLFQNGQFWKTISGLNFIYEPFPITQHTEKMCEHSDLYFFFVTSTFSSFSTRFSRFCFATSTFFSLLFSHLHRLSCVILFSIKWKNITFSSHIFPVSVIVFALP